jgi:hypothetical protein
VIYVLTFWIAVESRQPAAIIVGAAFGGFGGGYLWVCQGAYFTESAKLYAEATGESIEIATGKFGSLFATVFLTFEAGSKLVAGAIKSALPGEAAVLADGTVITIGSR